MIKYNKYIILILIVVSTVSYIFIATYFNNSRVILGFAILIPMLMTLFCITDAKEKKYRLPWSTYWLIFLFWPVAVPIYLFSSNKGNKKWIACGYIIAYFFLCTISIFISIITLPSAAYYAHYCGEYRIAIKLYSTLINQDKKDAWAYYYRGNAYDAIGLTVEGKHDHAMDRSLDASLFEHTLIKKRTQ